MNKQRISFILKIFPTKLFHVCVGYEIPASHNVCCSSRKKNALRENLNI